MDEVRSMTLTENNNAYHKNQLRHKSASKNKKVKLVDRNENDLEIIKKSILEPESHI